MSFLPMKKKDSRSYIGMVIESTTLDTEDKVIEIYGGTTWIQHTGYVLRGASSGVVANRAVKTGGNDDAVVVSHQHGINGIYGSGGYIGGERVFYTQYGAGVGTLATIQVGESGTNKNIPNYKSVYIWERTA